MKIAIIGAGPVGIYITKLLLDKNLKVSLIESGNENFESDLLNRSYYDFKTESAIPVGVHKIGGGSTKWRGRLSEFLKEDFKKLSKDGNRLWPFEKSELAKHYLKVYDSLGAGNFTDEEIVDRYFLNDSKYLPKDMYLRSFRFCKPEYFVDLFKQFEKEPNLELMTEHFCTNITKAPDGNQFQVNLLTSRRIQEKIIADKVIIACGALQSAALLHRSKEITPQSINNSLGIGLMEHIEGYIGKIKIRNKEEIKFFKSICNNYENRVLDEFHGIGVAISLVERNPVFTNHLNTQFEIRNYMPRPYYMNKLLDKLNWLWIKKFIEILLLFEKTIRFIFRFLRKIFDFSFGIMRVSIYLKAEELSFKESKVKVRDGLPFLVEYNHQVSTENYLLLAENLENFYFAFKNYFQARISYYSVVKSIDKLKKYFGSNWHPMGTTRLGLDQNNSVCDENLQVYGLENLFLVGASVFPTGSNTNPTFTSLALAHRLAESFHFHEPKN